MRHSIIINYSKKGNSMNNVKKSVIACIVLALVSINSLEANHGGKRHKKCKDPIVGTWNIRFEAERIRRRVGMEAEDITEATDTTEATDIEATDINEESDGNGQGGSVVLDGVGTFHKHGTVVIATIPKEPSNTANGTFSTMSYGLWKKVSKGVYKVILSSVTNQPRRRRDFRGKTCLKVVLIDDGEKALISGLFSRHPIRDLCFDRRTRPSWELLGRACKISLCDCEQKKHKHFVGKEDSVF